METLEELFTNFASAGAMYALQFERHIRASLEVSTAAHRSTGSKAYFELEWSYRDLDNAAHELDRLGRVLVEELLKHLEGEVAVEDRIFRFSGDDCIVRVDPGMQVVRYSVDKANEHPGFTPTPTDWLKLAAAFPVIQQVLKAPAV